MKLILSQEEIVSAIVDALAARHCAVGSDQIRLVPAWCRHANEQEVESITAEVAMTDNTPIPKGGKK